MYLYPILARGGCQEGAGVGKQGCQQAGRQPQPGQGMHRVCLSVCLCGGSCVGRCVLLVCLVSQMPRHVLCCGGHARLFSLCATSGVQPLWVDVAVAPTPASHLC